MVLTSEQRARMSKSSFALPGKAPGSGSYPISDLAHGRNALARVAQHGTPAEIAEVKRKVYAKFPGLRARAAHRQ